MKIRKTLQQGAVLATLALSQALHAQTFSSALGFAESHADPYSVLNSNMGSVLTAPSAVYSGILLHAQHMYLARTHEGTMALLPGSPEDKREHGIPSMRYTVMLDDRAHTEVSIVQPNMLQTGAETAQRGDFVLVNEQHDGGNNFHAFITPNPHPESYYAARNEGTSYLDRRDRIIGYIPVTDSPPENHDVDYPYAPMGPTIGIFESPHLHQRWNDEHNAYNPHTDKPKHVAPPSSPPHVTPTPITHHHSPDL